MALSGLSWNKDSLFIGRVQNISSVWKSSNETRILPELYSSSGIYH